MTFFTKKEFKEKYNLDLEPTDIYKIEVASEMIYSQVGLRYRNPQWDANNCPTAIKNASMEQLRFILEYDIPLIDYKGKVKAGDMESELSSDYSTLALRILGNAGYLNRGVPLNYNMGLDMNF
jgi:hypothetical protein